MASERGWTGRDWVTMAAAAGVVVLVAAIVAAAIAIIGGDSGKSVVLAPAAEAGVDPYTASLVSGPATTLSPGVTAKVAVARRTLSSDPTTHTLIATGTTPGLYGGSGDSRVCNPQQLVVFLGQNPQKEAAWASVLGISTRDVATYVGSLTPVLLTNDTLVTNHGYNDGHATSLQSVLQAGTAVMVDATGTPRVKCNCGNPLTPPEAIAPTDTTGTAWPGYTPTNVTVVRAGPPATTITVIDVKTGKLSPKPVGGGGTGRGTGGGQFVATSIGDPGYQGKYRTSADGTTWTVAAQLKEPVGGGLAWGDGHWLALSVVGGQTTVRQSTDLSTWTSLPTTVPAYLNDIAYGNGQWIAVGTESDSSIGHGVIYASADGRLWERVAPTDSPELSSVAYGNGTWIAVDNGHQGGDQSRTFRSADGVHWVQQNDRDLSNQAGSQIGYGAGQWALGGVVNTASGPPGDGVVSLSTDGSAWTTVPNTPFAGDAVTGIAYGNHEWVVITQSGAVFSSPDGQTWTPRTPVHGGAFDLSFGGDTTTQTSTTTTTTVGAATSSLRSFNWASYTYVDQACPTRGPITLTNGAWFEPGTKGTFEECSVKLEGVYYADLTGDGVEDAILRFHGSASPTRLGQSYWTTVFTTGGSGPVNRGIVSGPSFPPYSPATGIVVWVPDPQPGDIGDCCPGKYELDTYKWSSPTETFVHTRTSYADDSAYPG